MGKRTLSALDVANRRVLVRVDFNIPIEQGIEAIAAYDQRLRATLPTLRYLLERDCRIILCSHLGRPGGQADDTLRLAPVGDRLAALLNHPVKSLADCIGPAVAAEVDAMRPRDIVLLENLRFHPGEERNDPDFARELAALADCFVMDAFAVAHRAHASTVGLAHGLPAAMGLLVQREVAAMGAALESPAPPLAALMGGAKVSDKILVLENLLAKLNHLFIGGGMAVTFLRAQGYATGNSPVETDRLDFAREVLARAVAAGIAVHLPADVVVASSFAPDPAETRIVAVDQVPEGWYIMDIGPATAAAFAAALQSCQTIIWNGPMGVFEMPRFRQGTRTVAEAIAGLEKAASVVGGGSTAEAVEALGLMERMSHVSTGGGASLEFLEGRELPGIAVLPDV